MQDEASIAALVLAAWGHMLPPAKLLPTDIAQHRISHHGETSESLKWHPITSLYTDKVSSTAYIAQRPALFGHRGSNQHSQNIRGEDKKDTSLLSSFFLSSPLLPPRL